MLFRLTVFIAKFGLLSFFRSIDKIKRFFQSKIFDTRFYFVSFHSLWKMCIFERKKNSNFKNAFFTVDICFFFLFTRFDHTLLIVWFLISRKKKFKYSNLVEHLIHKHILIQTDNLYIHKYTKIRSHTHTSHIHRFFLLFFFLYLANNFIFKFIIIQTAFCL